MPVGGKSLRKLLAKDGLRLARDLAGSYKVKPDLVNQGRCPGLNARDLVNVFLILVSRCNVNETHCTSFQRMVRRSVIQIAECLKLADHLVIGNDRLYMRCSHQFTS